MKRRRVFLFEKKQELDVISEYDFLKLCKISRSLAFVELGKHEYVLDRGGWLIPTKEYIKSLRGFDGGDNEVKANPVKLKVKDGKLCMFFEDPHRPKRFVVPEELTDYAKWLLKMGYSPKTVYVAVVSAKNMHKWNGKLTTYQRWAQRLYQRYLKFREMEVGS